jgi:hypothetical protein
MTAPVPANSNCPVTKRAWEQARRPRLVHDDGADPDTAAFLAARAAVAARRRDLLVALATRDAGGSAP